MNEEYFRSDYYTGATERADDMIRANGAAEAREAEHLRSTAAEYSSEIEELKKLYEKNSALVEQLRAMNEETARNTLKSVQDASAQITQSGATRESTMLTMSLLAKRLHELYIHIGLYWVSVIEITRAFLSLANSIILSVLMEYLGKLIPTTQSLSLTLIICSKVSLTDVVLISLTLSLIMLR